MIQYHYLISIENTINSGCLNPPYELPEEEATGLVNLADSTYKDNLKAPNWDVGDMTQEEYRKLVFEMTTQFNQTSCPIDYPFVNAEGDGCI